MNRSLPWLFFILLALCSCEDGSSLEEATGQSIAFVQYVSSLSSDPQSSPTSVAVKMTKAQNAGDANIVAVCFFNETSTIASVADTKANSYAIAAPLFRDPTGPASCAIYEAQHIAAAAANANTITVTFSTKTLDPDVRIAEYSGIGGVDVSAAASGTTTAASSGPATTTQAGDLVIGSDYLSSSTVSPGAGFTQRILTSPDSDIFEDEIAGAPGPVAATATTGGGWWLMQMAAFKSSTGVDAGAEGGSDAGFDSASESGAEAGLDAGNDATPDSGADAGTDSAADASPDSAASDDAGDGAVGDDGSAEADGGGDGSTGGDATVDSGSDAGGATAALVQHVSGSNLRGNSLASPYCYTLQLPAPAQAGNAIVVGATWHGTSATLSVTDDQGDSYAALSTLRDSIDNQSVGIAGTVGVAAGARALSVCFSADPGGWVEPMATELAGVAGFDGAAGASGSGTTASVSLSAGADTLYQVVYTPGGAPSSFAGASMLSADILDGWAGQLGASSMTLGTSQHWASVALQLRPGAVGSVPSGMRIVRELHQNIPSSTGAGGNNDGFANPLALQIPSSGNLLVAVLGGGCGCDEAPEVTAITDSASNVWANPQTRHGGDAYSQLWYADNAATSSALNATLTWTTSFSDETAIVWDVAGASSMPLDVTVGGSGSTGPGNLTLPFTVTTAAPGELIFVGTPWDFDTAGGLLGSGGASAYLATMTTSGEPHDGPFPIDENNGWGHLVSGTSPTSITWVPLFGGEEFGNYSAVAGAFRSAP